MSKEKTLDEKELERIFSAYLYFDSKVHNYRGIITHNGTSENHKSMELTRIYINSSMSTDMDIEGLKIIVEETNMKDDKI